MEIRPLTDDDIEAFVDELWIPFAEEMAALDEFNALSETAREPAIEYRRERLTDDERIDYVAVVDGEWVGEAAGEINESPPVFAHGDVLHVNEVFVRPEHRGQGVASELMDALETWGRERGCTYANLNVNRRNESAQTLYRQRDYTVERHEMRKQL
ncbi:MAG: GNAT superfamily N-acetyltransferase [Natronomonas sp.]|jgi:GNAT superfamily N-acetyltransferase